jgi:hypothetical protein
VRRGRSSVWAGGVPRSVSAACTSQNTPARQAGGHHHGRRKVCCARRSVALLLRRLRRDANIFSLMEILKQSLNDIKEDLQLMEAARLAEVGRQAIENTKLES